MRQRYSCADRKEGAWPQKEGQTAFRYFRFRYPTCGCGRFEYKLLRRRSSKGAIAVSVSVIAVILLSVLLAGLAASADNLRLVRSKAEYLAETEKLRSAKVLIEWRLEEFAEGAVEKAAREWREKYPNPPAEQEREDSDRRGEFQTMLSKYFVNGYDIPFREKMGGEKLGDLIYRILWVRYDKERRSVLVKAAIAPRRFGAKNEHILYYSIGLEEPGEEEFKALWRGEDDVLKEKYRQRIRQELAHKKAQG